MKEIVLVGKPNSGKSSLFNKLTRLNQKVGNFAGVTVNLKYGQVEDFTLLDLPGLQSMQTNSPEEEISKNYILKLVESSSSMVFVANGMQLADSLFLFSQVADLCIPAILAINFSDELEKSNLEIDLAKIKEKIACPVVLINSKTGEGTDQLKTLITNDVFQVPNTVCRSNYDKFDGTAYVNGYFSFLENKPNLSEIEEDHSKRYKVVNAICRESILSHSTKVQLLRTNKWDKVLLSPYFGLPIFLFTLFILFQAVFSLSSYPMDWIDGGMASLSDYLGSVIPEGGFSDFVVNALIPGLGGVVIFIPQIAILFLLLGILEQTGYLSRISFISDAFLRLFGLSGQSIVPLMSSWACSIPAIMSARIIKDPRERLTVILASPLMTCSARLPVYTILIAVIFPNAEGTFWGAQGLALLSLYLLGVIATLAVSWVINKSSSQPSNPHWLLELPVYRMPNWRNIFVNVYQKTRSFVVQAGKIIFAISIILWGLAEFSPHDEAFINTEISKAIELSGTDENIEQSTKLEYSYLGYMGKVIEPAIRPLGYDWKIGIALVSSFAAREVFVGTLSTIYSIGSEDEKSIVERLRSEKILGTALPRFNIATAVSLLLFYVFAMQCMSTLAIVKKETGSWKYAMYQFVFMLVLAYFFAFVGYQSLS